MITTEYQVTGMTCSHCEMSVRDEVSRVGAIEQIDVSAATGRLLITTHAPIDDAAVMAAVDAAGYQVVRIR